MSRSAEMQCNIARATAKIENLGRLWIARLHCGQKARFARSKVRLLSFGSTCEFHSPDSNERRKQVEIGKQWVDLAHDTGAWGVKVRPNGLPKEVAPETTIGNIAAALVELLAERAGQRPPAWTCEIGAVSHPVFLLKAAEYMPRLRALCESESPEPLRRRGLFAPPEYLTFK